MRARPSCKKGLTKPNKTWTYGQFEAQAYSCDYGADFQEYIKAGKHSFTLLRKGKGLVKV